MLLVAAVLTLSALLHDGTSVSRAIPPAGGQLHSVVAADTGQPASGQMPEQPIGLDADALSIRSGRLDLRRWRLPHRLRG